MTSPDAARASFVALLRARQAEMQGLIDRILAWREPTRKMPPSEADRRRVRKRAQPAAQQSLL